MVLCDFTDFLSHLLTRITGAQRAVEGVAGCPSDAVWLTSWCVPQSTLPFVLPCPALRTAARSTLPPRTSAPHAGTDPLRYQSSALRRTASILEHRRRGCPAPQAPGPARRTAPSLLQAPTWKRPTCRHLLWQTRRHSGEKGRCPREESWSLLRLTPGWCERPPWRSIRTTPSGCCRGRSCRRNWSPGIKESSCRRHMPAAWMSRAPRAWRAPLHLICLHFNRWVLTVIGWNGCTLD